MLGKSPSCSLSTCYRQQGCADDLTGSRPIRLGGQVRARTVPITRVVEERRPRHLPPDARCRRQSPKGVKLSVVCVISEVAACARVDLDVLAVACLLKRPARTKDQCAAAACEESPSCDSHSARARQVVRDDACNKDCSVVLEGSRQRPLDREHRLRVDYEMACCRSLDGQGGSGPNRCSRGHGTLDRSIMRHIKRNVEPSLLWSGHRSTR